MDPQAIMDRALDFYVLIDDKIKEIELLRNEDGMADGEDIASLLVALSAHATILARFFVARGYPDEDVSQASDLAALVADDVWKNYLIWKHSHTTGSVVIPGPEEIT